MSLQYVIDGYNLINHPLFSPAGKRSRDPRFSLLEFIRTQRPCGSLKNKVIVVFDGYPPAISRDSYSCLDIEVIFSGDISADDKIERMLQKAADCRSIVVVSDDREIKFFAKSHRAKAKGIEEFISAAHPGISGSMRKGKLKTKKTEPMKPELSYMQVSKINKELESLWLK
ncbi:MAG: NYN domain-containing protein [Candidatus Omnitrophica bacterium]|nr:NYN domain-containing protein [Candidatus Omnitrophota bacterium]